MIDDGEISTISTGWPVRSIPKWSRCHTFSYETMTTGPRLGTRDTGVSWPWYPRVSLDSKTIERIEQDAQAYFEANCSAAVLSEDTTTMCKIKATSMEAVEGIQEVRAVQEEKNVKAAMRAQHRLARTNSARLGGVGHGQGGGLPGEHDRAAPQQKSGEVVCKKLRASNLRGATKRVAQPRQLTRTEVTNLKEHAKRFPQQHIKFMEEFIKAGKGPFGEAHKQASIHFAAELADNPKDACDSPKYLNSLVC